MLSVTSIEDVEKWDAIVYSFKNYNTYYLSGYSKAFRLHGDGEPLIFYHEDANIRAMNVVMKRDIEKDVHFTNKLPQDTYFDLATPYGYGGFLVEGETTDNSLKKLDTEYSAFCKNHGIISEFVRFQPIMKNYNGLDCIYKINKLGKTISMNLYSKEQIWSDLTSSSRGRVRKAMTAGVEIFCGRDAELFKEFIHLYKVTMDRDNATDYYYFKDGFYKSIQNELEHNALIFYAVYQDVIIAMSIILFANHQMHYHLGASNKEYQYLAPNNLLFYEAAIWGCENGYSTFHLGGGLGSSEDSLYKFKSGFNKNSNNIFAIGQKIFDENKYEELINIRKAMAGVDTNSSYFPKYRAVFG